jgi:thiamine-phosphate pyrophosphorylase
VDRLPTLQAILDVEVAERAGWVPIDLARAFLDGGARLIQIRAKRLASGAFLDLCDAVVALGKGYGAHIIINDRIDLAMISGAAGVHLGQEDLPPATARSQLGSTAIVGYSTHDVEQAGRAANEPVTYVAVGPLFQTMTKETGYQPVGLALVRAAAQVSRGLPIVAIGGITLDSAPRVLDAGATSVAVIGDLLAGNDPAARVASYNRLASAGSGG